MHILCANMLAQRETPTEATLKGVDIAKSSCRHVEKSTTDLYMSKTTVHDVARHRIDLKGRCFLRRKLFKTASPEDCIVGPTLEQAQTSKHCSFYSKGNKHSSSGQQDYCNKPVLTVRDMLSCASDPPEARNALSIRVSLQ